MQLQIAKSGYQNDQNYGADTDQEWVRFVRTSIATWRLLELLIPVAIHTRL